jgi:hypothetical protein
MLETVDAFYRVSLLKSQLRGVPWSMVMGTSAPALGPLDTTYCVKHIGQSLPCWAFKQRLPSSASSRLLCLVLYSLPCCALTHNIVF